MKVLYVINGLRFGGMERQLVATIKAVSEAGHNVYLAVLNEEGPMAANLEMYLSHGIYYLDRRKTRILKTMIKIAKLTKSLEVDIIHVQDSFSAFYAIPVAKMLGVKIINGSIRHAGISKGFDYIFEKSLLSLSSAVVANSQAGLDFFRLKGHVVYNFIDQNRFKRTKAPMTKIVMNANFSDYKDHLTLLTAGKRLIDEGLISEIGLIGDGKHRRFFEELCKKMGISDRVVFHGHSAKVEELLLNYGIGVLCSTIEYQEGISNSILEYMGSGLIAIGSDLGAVPEIITDAYNGFLFRAEDPESLSGKIRFILNNPDMMREIRRNAYETLQSKFSIETNCAQLIDVYDKVLLSNKVRYTASV